MLATLTRQIQQEAAEVELMTDAAQRALPVITDVADMGALAKRYAAALGPLLLACGGDGPTILYMSQAAFYVVRAVIAAIISGPNVRGVNLSQQPIGGTPGTRDPNLAFNIHAMSDVIRQSYGETLLRAWRVFVVAVVGQPSTAFTRGPRVPGL